MKQAIDVAVCGSVQRTLLANVWKIMVNLNQYVSACPYELQIIRFELTAV